MLTHSDETDMIRPQVAQGKVRNVTAENAAQLMQEGWVLLDVRPQSEIEKAGVKGAVEVHAAIAHAHCAGPPAAVHMVA
jgi:rhodanese-related sulfurtransferase